MTLTACLCGRHVVEVGRVIHDRGGANRNLRYGFVYRHARIPHSTDSRFDTLALPWQSLAFISAGGCTMSAARGSPAPSSGGRNLD